MPIPIPQAALQTTLVIACLVVGILATLKRVSTTAFSKDTTLELKGYAILAVLFAHIGYGLAADSTFLFPLSISAGVAVNLFLFLSGYGLTTSHLEKPLSPWIFYKKRLTKIVILLWMTLGLFYLLDTFILGRTYSITSILQSFFGFFPIADLFQSLNSPLWYLTLIFGYYAAFPWIMRSMRPRAAAYLLGSLGLFFAFVAPLPVSEGVRSLYQMHVLAFPLGVLWADWMAKKSLDETTHEISKHGLSQQKERALLILVSLGLFMYTSLHAAVGEGVLAEQLVSLITLGSLLVFFACKNVASRLLIWLGTYSYEIYLLHWPLLSRYDLFYRFLPAWIATLLYIALLLMAGKILHLITTKLSKRADPRPV